MADLFIDPFILACPNEGCSQEEFENYVNHLINWQELKECEWTDIFISRKTSAILFDEKKYPLWDHLQKIINSFGIDYIQTKDIVNLVDAFIIKFKSLEDNLNINEIIFFEYISDPRIKRESKAFENILFETLALMSLKSFLRHEKTENQILISNLGEITFICIKTTVGLFEFSDENRLNENHVIDDCFTCCNNFSQLTLSINTILLWKKCEKASSFNKVISIHTLMIANTVGLKKLETDLNFILGTGFLNSVRNLLFDSQEKRIEILLKAISEVILNINLPTTHAIREDKGADSSQVTHNTYKAWRKDIDYEYHLHYWKRGEEVILANIVTHNDFSIFLP